MTFSHPFSRYGLALLMLKEEIESVEEITSEMLLKYLEDGLNHFRMTTDNNPELDDILLFRYIAKQDIDDGKAKKGNNAFYLTPNIITNDLKASNSWKTISALLNKLRASSADILGKTEKITMGIAPIAGEINNGTKSKKNATGIFLEAACCAITNTTPIKPNLAYREKGGKYVPTAIIPDLELDEMKVFIQLYNLMLNTIINQKILLEKKVYRKNGKTPDFSKLRPKIYNGNFPYAPQNSAFGVVGLLGAIGRWAKEAGYINEGQKVLESLKNKPLYIVQYGNAQSVTFSHYIIDLAKENKLSEIVFAIQKSTIIHPFDETKHDHKKGIESRKERFNLFSSRFLQLFNKPTFKDFISVRAEYSNKLIELFNTFFLKQMKISKEVVQSVRALGLWLNDVAFAVGKSEEEKDKKKNKYEIKQKVLVELESSVFGARKPAEVLNVIVRAGRLSGKDAPSESDLFKEAVLTGEITMDDAKSMLMAYARTRNSYESDSYHEPPSGNIETEEFDDPDVTQ